MRWRIVFLILFYIQVSARKTAKELEFNYRLVHRKFMQFRKKIAEYCNQEARKLNGELNLMNLMSRFRHLDIRRAV